MIIYALHKTKLDALHDKRLSESIYDAWKFDISLRSIKTWSIGRSVHELNKEFTISGEKSRYVTCWNSISACNWNSGTKQAVLFESLGWCKQPTAYCNYKIANDMYKYLNYIPFQKRSVDNDKDQVKRIEEIALRLELNFVEVAVFMFKRCLKGASTWWWRRKVHCCFS